MQFQYDFRIGELFESSWGALMLICAAIILFITLWYYLARKYPMLKSPLAIFATVIQIAYLTWRCVFTIPTASVAGFTIGIILISMEILGFVKTAAYRILYMKKPERKNKRLSNLPYVPEVDVLITTYNEPAKVIRRTVAAAAGLRYPKEKYRIYVCDDGSRREIRDICHEFNAVWVTRDNNEHAKAGNLNNCFKKYAKGEFAVILDADMVIKNDFLQKTLGYFSESDVAFVQAPQVFFNPDPFQRNLSLERKIPNEQDFFMQEVQAQRQEYNALLFVGSNCVFRRSHLNDIGLIPTGSITEDMATSLLLQSKGYRGILVTDTFALGLSAENFTDYIAQHTRWCRGNIQVLRKWNPWKMKGLDFFQKLIITDGVWHWFFGLQKIVYILCPILFLLTGIPFYVADFFVMLLFMLPSFYASSLVFKVFSHKNRTQTWAHIYETALAPYLSFAALKELFFRRAKKFNVTPKGVTKDKREFVIRVALPHLVLTALSVIALASGIFKIVAGSSYMIPVCALNMAWVEYNLFALLISIFICFEKPRVRKEDRLKVDSTANLKFGNISCTGRFINISEGGCNVIPDYPDNILEYYAGGKIEVELDGFSVKGNILRYIPGKKSYAVQFEEMDNLTYMRLVQYIFSSQSEGYGSMAEKSVIKTLSGRISKNIEAAAGKAEYRKKQRAKEKEGIYIPSGYYVAKSSKIV